MENAGNIRGEADRSGYGSVLGPTFAASVFGRSWFFLDDSAKPILMGPQIDLELEGRKLHEFARAEFGRPAFVMRRDLAASKTGTGNGYAWAGTIFGVSGQGGRPRDGNAVLLHRSGNRLAPHPQLAPFPTLPWDGDGPLMEDQSPWKTWGKPTRLSSSQRPSSAQGRDQFRSPKGQPSPLESPYRKGQTGRGRWLLRCALPTTVRARRAGGRWPGSPSGRRVLACSKGPLLGPGPRRGWASDGADDIHPPKQLE